MNSSQSQHNLIIKQKTKSKKSKYFELQSSDDDDQQNQQDHDYLYNNINQKQNLIQQKQNLSNNKKTYQYPIKDQQYTKDQYHHQQQNQSYKQLLENNKFLRLQNKQLKQINKHILQQYKKIQRQNVRLSKEVQQLRRYYFSNNNNNNNNINNNINININTIKNNNNKNNNSNKNKKDLTRHFHPLHYKHCEKQQQSENILSSDQQNNPLIQLSSILPAPFIQLPTTIPLLQQYPQLYHQLISFFPNRKIISITAKFKSSFYNFHIDQFYKSCGNIKNNIILCITNNNKIIGGYTPWEHKFNGEYRDKQWLYAYDIDKLWLTKQKGEKYECVPDMKKESFLFQLEYKGKRQDKQNHQTQQNMNKNNNIDNNIDITNYKHRKFPLKNSKISIQRHQKNKCIYFGSGQLIIGQYPYYYYQYKMKQKQDYNTCMSFNINNNLSSYDFSHPSSNSQSFQPHPSYQFTPSQYLNLGNYFNLYNPAFTTKYQNHSQYISNKLNWLEQQNKSYKNQLLWNGNKTNVFMLREYECYEVVFDENCQKEKEIKMFYNSKCDVHKALVNNHKLLNRKINKQKAIVLVNQLNQSRIISKNPPHVLSSILSLFQTKQVSSLHLLYRSSLSNFSTQTFFSKHGSTPSCLFLIQTTNKCIIGSYTPLYFNLLTQYDSSLQDSSNQSFTFTLPNYYNPIQKFIFSNKTNSIRRFQSDKNIRFGGGMIVLEDKNKEGWSYLSNSVYINHKFKNIKDNYIKYMKEDCKYFQIKQWEVIHVKFKEK